MRTPAHDTSPEAARRLPHRPPPAGRRHATRDRPRPRRRRRPSPTAPPPRPAPSTIPARAGPSALVRDSTIRRTLERSTGVADHFGRRRRRPTRRASTGWAPTTSPPAARWPSIPRRCTKDGHGLLPRNFDFPTATFTADRRPPAAARRTAARRRPVGHRAPPRRRLRLDRHRDHGPDGRHGRHQRGRARRRPARRQRDSRARADRHAAGRPGRAAGRPLPARHLRDRRRGQGGAPAREALLLLHAVPLRGRRPLRRVLRVGALAAPQPTR